MNLSKFAVYSILPLSLALLVGCDSNDSYRTDFDAGNVEMGEVRYTTVVADAPGIRFALDGNDRSWQSYGASSNIVGTYGGPLAITAEAQGAGDATVAISNTISLTVADNIRYDILAIGSLAGGSELVQLPEIATDFAEAETSARIVVAHMAPDAPAVDVYLTEPSVALADATAVGTMSYEQNLGPVILEIPENDDEERVGDYRVRVTATGTTDVVYDSGSVELEAGDDIVAVAIANTNVAASAAKSPVSLLVLTDGDGASVVRSDADPAELQTVNISANSESVDTGLNLVFSTDDASTTVATNLGFTDVADYQDVAADEYAVSAVSPTIDEGWLDATTSTLAAGGTYTALMFNRLQELEYMLVVDDPRSIDNKARLRVIHGSPVAGEVDIYVTETDSIADADAVVSGAETGAVTDYWLYDAGTYYVTVTPAGEDTAAIGPLSVTLSDGGVYTIVARDNATLDGADVSLLGDF